MSLEASSITSFMDSQFFGNESFLLECLDSIDSAVSKFQEWDDSHSLHVDNVIVSSNTQKSRELKEEGRWIYGNNAYNLYIESDNINDESMLMNIPCPYFYFNGENFPKLVTEAFNNGDMDSVKSILVFHLDRNCEFRFKKPNHIRSDRGLNSVIDFITNVYYICPDAIFMLRGMRKKQLKDGYILRCKINFAATITDTVTYESRCIRICGKLPAWADSMDSSKISQSDIDATRVTELLIKEQKKLMQTYMKGFLYLHVNEVNKKIDMYDLTLSLSSLKAFEG